MATVQRPACDNHALHTSSSMRLYVKDTRKCSRLAFWYKDHVCRLGSSASTLTLPTSSKRAIFCKGQLAGCVAPSTACQCNFTTHLCMLGCMCMLLACSLLGTGSQRAISILRRVQIAGAHCKKISGLASLVSHTLCVSSVPFCQS